MVCVAICIGLIYLIDKENKSKAEKGMQRAAGVIAVVMLLTVNLPVLAGLYEEIIVGNNESNVDHYYDEEKSEEEPYLGEEKEEYAYDEETYSEENKYEEKKEEIEYIEIDAMGGYIPIMPLLATIDSPIGAFTVGNGETVEVVAGGVVSGNITVQAGGTLYVEDGAIINARVITSGTFTMNGGIISGNTVSVSGGGVSVSGGIFTMNGGEISGNTSISGEGGGVFVSAGEFTMNGGEISGNNAHTGGGVRAWRNFHNE